MKNKKGVTLIEVFFVLGIIVFLATFMAPSVYDYVKDAKAVKAKVEVEIIGVVTTRLIFDIGSPCFKKDGRLSCEEPNRANIIYGNGLDVTEDQVAVPDFIYHQIDIGLFRSLCGDGLYLDRHDCIKQYPQICSRKKINWFDDEQHGSPMEGQFNTNLPQYLTPGQKYFPMPTGPWPAQGWRGAYLSPPVGVDPWGHRYLVNSLFTSIPQNVDVWGLFS